MSAVKQQPVFTPKTNFPLVVNLPKIYPEPFTFHMRVQLVADAFEAQKNFIGLPDTDKQGEAFHQYDAEMISILSTKAPEGFPDFPAFDKTSNLSEKDWLRTTLREYFLPTDPERREGFRFICRRAMAMYWEAIQPEQYL